jgi:hypothetical protein
MQEILVQIIFGWPFIILSLLLAVTGVIMKRPALLVAAALFFTPPAWYLSGYPSIRWFGLLLPVFILGAAYFVKRGKAGIAWALLSPPILASAWLAFLVMAQNRNLSGG